MNSNIKILNILLTFILISSINIFSINASDTSSLQVGVDEKLGETIPLDISFLDETGKSVTLRELITKPTLLTLVYYRCPGICSPLMNGVASAIEKLDLKAGTDYNIVTISFNPREDYIMASEKKQNYLANLKIKIPEQSWKFLTGDSNNIAAITNAVGFRYMSQGEDYIHGAVVTVLSPNGKIARYLYGTEFLPMDVKLAIIEASEGKSTPAINKLLKICYSYDPEGRTYVLNVTRIFGAGMLIFIAGFVIILTIKKKKNKYNIPGSFINGKGSENNG